MIVCPYYVLWLKIIRVARIFLFLFLRNFGSIPFSSVPCEECHGRLKRDSNSSTKVLVKLNFNLSFYSFWVLNLCFMDSISSNFLKS
jgi:hypothetical protein